MIRNGDERRARYENENDRSKKIGDEVKKQLWLAGPLIAVNLLQYSRQMISLMFVGHLGELPLSAASMATSFAVVTGFSLLLGIASALDTLCGQSYGARQYSLVGVHMQRSLFILVLLSIPLAIIWLNTRNILVLIGQDPDIAKKAGEYACFMVPSLFAYGLLQCLVKFLQAQNIVFSLMMCTGITTLLHILLCWVMVFKFGFGFRGPALANSISYWINVLLLVFYIKFSPSCAKTRAGFSKEAFDNIFTFLRLAIPSAIMVCLKMWSFESMVLLSGLLPNPTLQTSLISICLDTASVVWMIPSGLNGAISTRISNELGAGNPEAARLAVYVVVAMAIFEGFWFSPFLTVIWNLLVSEIGIPKLITMSTIIAGIARGCGWQKIGAYVNLGAYYLLGIPFAIVLAFVLDVGGKGLWLGIICALVVQVTIYIILTIRTNWEQEAIKATKRVYDYAIPVEFVS